MMQRDTSPAAATLQARVRRRLSGVQRIRIAMEMSLLARKLALAGLRRRHPDWPEADLRKQLLRRQFPPDKIPQPLR